MLPWILCGCLSALAAALLVKVLLLKRSMDEILTEFSRPLSCNTNTLVSVSSMDRAVRRLAAGINAHLRELRRQRLRYLNGNRELKEAVANISHDLRTPLTAIFGYLDLLAAESHTPASRRYIDIIQNRAELLKSLTEELFAYSVVLSNEGALKKEPVVLNRAVEESVAAFYTLLSERGIAPRVQMPEFPVICRLDSAALSRVLSNLMHNALKYSDGDLEITLDASGALTFTNTAQSLSEVQAGKLFDRFYTVENAGRSTGLGLSIARTLVEQMGGVVTAAYRQGRLTVRIEWLPQPCA